MATFSLPLIQVSNLISVQWSQVQAPAQPHNFSGDWSEILFMAIFSLPLTLIGQFSVSGRSILHNWYSLTTLTKPAQERYE